MKRKDFIKKSALASLGIAFTPTLLLSGKNSLQQITSNFKGKVVIVGAGAAGVYAGFLLKSKGIDFTIIEATAVAGGRLGKQTNFADFPIDSGAQWLHGRHSILGDLVKKTRTNITKDRSKTVYYFNHKLTDSLPQKVHSIVKPKQSLPDLSYRAYAQNKGLSNEYKFIVEQLAGDFGADSSELSIKWTAIEEDNWSSGNNDFKFEDSFFDLIDKNIIDKIRSSILFNTPIQTIDYTSQKIRLIARNNKSYTADKVIVTVPIPILQDDDITFVPPLPEEKTKAFQKIGIGAGMKVFLKFNTKFYHENIVGGAISAAYADDSIGKAGKDHVLMAFVMGKQAEALTNLGNDTAITNALLAELDEMYKGKASRAFLQSHVVNWTTHPYIKGAYSYSKVGIGNARSIAAATVNNKLFFAGEAMNLNGHHQTVHGAVETALLAVKSILA